MKNQSRNKHSRSNQSEKGANRRTASVKNLDGNTGSLALTLSRTVSLKRYPVIAKVTFLRERPDLQTLLKAILHKPTDMPPRMKAYLKQEALWDSSGITEKGQHVIDTGLFETKERGLYHIWYTNNDRLLGTLPVLMQRDTAFFEPSKESWKKGVDAARSEFRVDQPLRLNVLEESFADRNSSELKSITLPLSSLEPEVICSSEKSAEIELIWQLGISNSTVNLKGSLDMLNFQAQNRHHKPSSRPEVLELCMNDFGDRINDVMMAVASEFDGQWQPEKQCLTAPLNQIDHYPSAVEKFQISRFNHSDLNTSMDVFRSIEAKYIPIQPVDQNDAEDWHRFWLQEFYRKQYHSSATARKQQSEWLNNTALNDFELPLKEHHSLLSELKKETQPDAYWHIAAMADLTPSSSSKLRMPTSLVNGDKLDINTLLQQLTNEEPILQVIYSDRYVHTPRHSRNLKTIADCLKNADGLVLTLDKPHGRIAKLPANWSHKTLRKESDNHGRYWILIGSKQTWCWECSSGLDFIRENDSSFSVDGSPTFTPKEVTELPQYLQNQISHVHSMSNNIVTEAL
jgi:hypothetical protein